MTITHPAGTIPAQSTTVWPFLRHWFAGWAVCTAIMAIGPAFMSMDATLVVHAAAAPVVFGALSWRYFSRYDEPAPIVAAAGFVGLVVAVDFVLVAVVIMRSLEMFASPLGTWIPFGLIFVATYLAGTAARIRRTERHAHVR